ncbi:MULTISPECIES: sugar kinase [unclassified Sphingomonas]|uniref:sugar kinase n=1 Tax=unclassified Sphingomonas TaxID=196159 RepID=UPI00226AC09D|nr:MULTISPECIES: sugar kinase [unclassified Sphingomonas]
MAKIVVVGEGMIELAGDGAGGWRLGHGGDTLNSAVHLARLGGDVAYLTALGDDPFSRDLLGAWAAEGIDTTMILTDPRRRPGLYAITNDPDGERHFTYWRGESAARGLFALPGIDAALVEAERADLLVFSMISLAILPPEGRRALFALAARVRRRGGRVAFDTNYRPALWHDRDDALAAHAEAIALTDIGLPTLEDEAALTGTGEAAAVLAAWRAAGVGETVVKLGAAGCLADGIAVPPPEALVPRDTSGAGDAFNAGYLHARLAGDPPAVAALAGHRLAGWVVMNRGAVPARTADAPYASLARGG